MSLVAYAASSDEESECEDEITNVPAKVQQVQSKQLLSTENGHISDDDDDDYERVDVSDIKKPLSLTLALPKPKNVVSHSIDEQLSDFITPAFAKLPTPKTAARSNEIIEEADDEYLHKKAVPLKEEEQLKKTKGTVKISIPSLKEFHDVDKDMAKSSSKNVINTKPKGCGLLSILPQAKSEQNFSKCTETVAGAAALPIQKPAFVPDTVRNRRAALNTEGVDGINKRTATKEKTLKKAEENCKIKLVNCSDSEDDEDADESGGTALGDFFSLNKAEELPEVSANEINAMVAKRAAKMAESTTKYLQEMAAKERAETEQQMPQQVDDEQMREAQKRYHEKEKLDAQAMQALVGSSAKRRRQEQKHMHIMDISSEQVLPSQEEWMRTALASSTTYQPTGVLTDEEPAAGTRRKHQITYLAHKAKANEAELQAMWSANRQTRRATSNKYGF